jgi:Holliday junction resolvase RusA-like endonuclease
MSEGVTITVAGDPQGKGRARAFRRGNFIGHYTPEKTRTYEGIIRSMAMDAMAGRLPIESPVEIDLSIIFAVPASWSQKKRAQALAGQVRPAKKPDADNVIKAFTDAMNGVVYKDDVQIIKGRFSKSYGPAAMVCATVREVSE